MSYWPSLNDAKRHAALTETAIHVYLHFLTTLTAVVQYDY